MPNTVYFGRPLYIEVKPYTIELVGSQPIGGNSNRCNFTIDLDSHLFAKLFHHRTSGALIETVSIYYNRRDNVTYYMAELTNATVEILHASEVNTSMFVDLSFVRMTARAL